MTARLLIAAALTLPLLGCLGVHTGRPTQRGSRYVKPIERPDIAEPVAWKEVYLGQGPRSQHIGYIESRRSGPGEMLHHWIYNHDFVLVGRLTPNGDLYRINDKRRSERYEGSYFTDHAMLTIFRKDPKALITYRRMPPPR